jgi:2-dehydropantoate 2-reductase
MSGGSAVCDTRRMRFVVIGAGAVGGVVGCQLHRAGHDVTLVARGDHYKAIRDRGLAFESPAERLRLEIPVVHSIHDVAVESGCVVLLAVKSQDTATCVTALAEIADPATSVVCVQNGVENERTALRYFSNVYGIPVMCPTLYLEPGVVCAYSAPVTGILDIGRYPNGTDRVGSEIAAALKGATFVSEVRADIMRWKYRKLIRNLRNGVEAVCGNGPARGRIGDLVTEEAERVLAVAGIEVAPLEEDEQRRGKILRTGPIDGVARPGSSVWQSLKRRTGTAETDYLNGHIVLLGRLHGIATPSNSLVQRLVATLASSRAAPGTMSEKDFLAMLDGVTEFDREKG